MNTITLESQRQHFGGDANRWPDARGRYHGTCPSCGKPPVDKNGRKATHWSIYPTPRGHAHRCFVCGFAGNLSELLDSDVVVQERPQRRQEQQKPRHWQVDPWRWLESYCGTLDRVQRWQDYKPLSLDTIARYHLGVGRLPSSQCEHRRLVYPLFQGDKIVGFRGRAIACDCPKWLTCGGSQTVCVNLDLVTPGAQVVIVENPVDAWFTMQETPDVIAVASTAGAGTWRAEWTRALAAARPSQVIVWLDNDMAGCPNLRTYNRLRNAWERDHPGKRAPEPNGPRILAQLRAARLDATLYRWPDDAPAKYDVGSYLIDTMEVAA